MNIYGAMNTAKWALLSQQTAIEITGQNIANVNNPDYNKQEVVLQAQFPVNQGNYFVGTGVTIASVQRRFDQFLFSQRLDNNTSLNSWTARNDILKRVDTVMNEAQGSGINNAMSNFFQSFYSLSANPAGATERQDVVNQAKNLSQKAAYVATQLKTIRKDIDLKITGAIPQINQISAQIANMNKVIHETESNGATANDYRDKREGLIKSLSNLVDVNYTEMSNGEVMVFMKTGRPLVSGQDTFALSSRQNPSDPETSSVFWQDSAGNSANVTADIQAGQMGAWATLRDTDLTGTLNKLDTLAASIIRDVNRIHNGAYGLDGSTGNNFFNGLTPGGRASNLNSGTGQLQTGSILNADNVDLDHFRITFTGGGTYNVYNMDKASASGTYAFTAGSPLTFFQQRGISIAINGAPAANDSFEISGVYNAAFNMGINPVLNGDTNKVAAGATQNWGDGLAAEQIASLQYAKTINAQWSAAGYTSGTYTFTDFYGAAVGDVGSATNAAKDGQTMAQAVSNQLSNLRDQNSAVALDEEMINLIKYQKAYGAAAKTITTVDEMLQTLLNIQ